MFNKVTSFSIDRDNVEILDNELVKTASEILLPEGHEYDPDFVYMKVRAVSAGEYWGCNKNADFFPEEELKKNYKTFFDAHVFKNHENKEVEKAIGDVLDAVWNDEMKYVELFIRVDKRIAPTIARGFEKGFMTDVSMGCKIDYSICSICGNQAKTQSQYCDHIKYERHKVRDDGKKVFEININPRFHDISAVLNGADRTAKMTGLFISGTKVAYHEDENMEKCASTLADALFDEPEIEKEAFVGAGVNVVRGKNGLGIDIGFPYGVSINAPFGNSTESNQAVFGIGLTGPHVGVSFMNEYKQKEQKKKKKEELENKLTNEHQKRMKSNNMMQKKAHEELFFDSMPLFEKTASAKVSKKASELEKIAEIKKRIKGNVLAVAKSRAALAEENRINEAAKELRMNGVIRPLSEDAMNRFADGINRLSDSEEVMVEQVLTTALKMLSLAGVNLTPAEFTHIMRRIIGVQCPKVVKICPAHIDRDVVVRHFDNRVDEYRRMHQGMNMPTIFNVLKSIAGNALPVTSGHRAAIPARIVITKVASCDGVTRPEVPGLNLEDKVLKLASEIIEERSLHIPHMANRIITTESEIEKEAGSADELSVLDHYYDFLVEKPVEKVASEDVYEAVERQAYGVYQNLVADYVESPEFNGDLYRFASEVGVDDASMEKCAKNIAKSMNVGLGTYLYSKYQGVKAREGRPQSTLNRTMAENPGVSAIGAALITKKVLDSKEKLGKGAKKALKYIAKTADENMDLYLGEVVEAINDDLADIDIFKDSVINTKMALDYSPKQIDLIKTASIMYAQGRQDLCDNLLSIEGLGYDSINNFLQVCEDTLFEELEKKASIGKVVGTVVGGATKAVGKLTQKAAPVAQKAVTGMKSIGSSAATAFNNNATPGMKNAVGKIGAGVNKIKGDIAGMNTAGKVGLGASITGTGLAVHNTIQNKKNQQLQQ